jgi:hypothetical protein
MEPLLNALKRTNFDWVMRLDDVWRDGLYHVPEINATIREDLLDRLRQVGADPRGASPLGWVLLGPAGAGKTHMLGGIRREIKNGFFVLVDLTDVNDFWDAVLLGYINSLREPENNPQLHRVLLGIFNLLGLSEIKAEKNIETLAKAGPAVLARHANRILEALSRQYRRKIMDHQDVFRALLLLNSRNFDLESIGYNYLQGARLEPDEAARVGLRKPRTEPLRIMSGISWLISLAGPTLLALDQMDAIVREQHVAGDWSDTAQPTDEQQAARAIIENLGLGLTSLPDHTYRTLSVITCLESTWDILRKTVLHSTLDRFESPKTLRPLPDPQSAAMMVAQRLAPGFRAERVKPPYPTWPFSSACFNEAALFTPREVLKRCETHRRACLSKARPWELKTFGAVSAPVEIDQSAGSLRRVDALFRQAKASADPTAYWDERNEDRLGRLIQIALRCLIRERPLPEDVDVLLETRFTGGVSFTPIHARLRLVYVAQGAEETHICFRALQKKHHTAYLARLRAAVTYAGIDQKISFRRLFIIRRDPLPTGPKSAKITALFQKAGGRFIDLNSDDMAVLIALKVLNHNPPPYFNEWLRDRRPVSRLALARETAPELFYSETDSESQT